MSLNDKGNGPMRKREARAIAAQVVHQLIQNFLEDGGCRPHDDGHRLFGIESERDAAMVDGALAELQQRLLEEPLP